MTLYLKANRFSYIMKNSSTLEKRCSIKTGCICEQQLQQNGLFPERCPKKPIYR